MLLLLLAVLRRHFADTQPHWPGCQCGAGDAARREDQRLDQQVPLDLTFRDEPVPRSARQLIRGKPVILNSSITSA
jgi:hypothetical protein